MSPEVLLVAGARPNFMKIAPLSAAIRSDGRLRGTVEIDVPAGRIVSILAADLAGGRG